MIQPARPFVILLSLAMPAIAVLGVSCSNDSGDDDGADGADETSPPPPPPPCPDCGDCDPGEVLYGCVCDPPFDVPYFYPGDCSFACVSNPGYALTLIQCDDACDEIADPYDSDSFLQAVCGEFSTSCTSWDPESEVSFSSGVYHVDASFIDGLIADPSPLYECDNAYFEGQSGGGFMLRDADNGELLYELGFRDDDIPLLVNGFTVDDFAEVATVLVDQYYAQGETEYAVVVSRNMSNTTLLFEIDP